MRVWLPYSPQKALLDAFPGFSLSTLDVPAKSRELGWLRACTGLAAEAQEEAGAQEESEGTRARENNPIAATGFVLGLIAANMAARSLCC